MDLVCLIAIEYRSVRDHLHSSKTVPLIRTSGDSSVNRSLSTLIRNRPVHDHLVSLETTQFNPPSDDSSVGLACSIPIEYWSVRDRLLCPKGTSSFGRARKRRWFESYRSSCCIRVYRIVYFLWKISDSPSRRRTRRLLYFCRG